MAKGMIGEVMQKQIQNSVNPSFVDDTIRGDEVTDEAKLEFLTWNSHLFHDFGDDFSAGQLAKKRLEGTQTAVVFFRCIRVDSFWERTKSRTGPTTVFLTATNFRQS